MVERKLGQPGRLKLNKSLSLCLSLMVAGNASVASLLVMPQPALAKKSKSHKSKEQGPEAPSATGLDRQTLNLINSGNWKDASVRLEELAPLSAPISRNHVWLAFAYLFLGKCDDTAKLSAQYPASSAAEPDEHEMYTLLLAALDQTCHGKFDKADAVLKNVTGKYLSDSMVNFVMAAVQGKEGHAVPAASYCQRAVELAPDFGWGFRTLGYLEQKWLKDPVKAEQSYLAALSIQPMLPEATDNVVDLKLAHNDFDGAIDISKKAIALDGKNGVNYYRLSQIYIQQWRLKEALVQLEQAISCDATAARFYRSRASIKRYQGFLNDAIADQQQAVDLSKDKPFDLVELSAMNSAAGNVNRAADNLQEALKLDPDNQTAHDKLVELLKQEKRFDDLIAEFKRATTRKPKDAALRIGLAAAYVSAGKQTEAIEEFKNAANLDTTNPEPHRQLAALLLAKNDFEGAAREYKYALNINPSSVPDMVSLGYCYALTDEYTNAEAAFVTALALQQLTQPETAVTSPGRLGLMRSLATLLLDEGRYSDAASQFELIAASSKGTDANANDVFMLSSCKALRDLSQASAKNLLAAYEQLSKEQQVKKKDALIETLLEAGKVDMATPYMEKAEAAAREKNIVDSQLLVEKSKALRLKGDAKGAEAAALEAQADKEITDSMLSESMLAQAEAQFAKGDLALANNTATKAIEKYAKNYRAYILIGRINLKNGKPKDAIAAAKKALENNGGNPYSTRAYLLMGDAQVADGALKDASASYKKAAELYPGLIEAHKSLLETLRKLAMKDEARKEEEQIAQMEKQR